MVKQRKKNIIRKAKQITVTADEQQRYRSKKKKKEQGCSFHKPFFQKPPIFSKKSSLVTPEWARNLVISSTSSTPLSTNEAFEQILPQKCRHIYGKRAKRAENGPFKISPNAQSRAFAAPACQGTGQGHAVGSFDCSENKPGLYKW